MKVLKFGGTSVGSAENIKKVSQIVADIKPRFVVLSAVSGTTNDLVAICDFLYTGQKEGANKVIEKFNFKYSELIGALYDSDEFKNKATDIYCEFIDLLKSIISAEFSEKEEKIVLAQGEVVSTKLFTIKQEELGSNVLLLDSLEFMRLTSENEPDLDFSRIELGRILATHSNVGLFVVQGYICRNSDGEVDNLQRGGSDYSASLLAEAVDSSELQIWTDIDGMHYNDPRIVKHTKSIPKLSFEEAGELAYFGAKILHPYCLLPTRRKGIPVRLKNTMDPDAVGTYISEDTSEFGIKAVAAKDGIIVIKIKSTRMFLAHGFLRRLFEVFEKYETAVDVITTSEVAVSLTIDDGKNLNQIVDELSVYGDVHVEKEQCIIAIVGNFIADEKGTASKIFDSLRDIPLRMISFGGSKHNVTLLVSGKHKKEALNALNDSLFAEKG
ncbi:MAG: aspartate kinase [Cyclobacteriaceae bacterium]|jgi:aspartate kinase